MNLLNLCGPVVLYLGFSLIQIIIDTFRQHYNVALLKFIVMIVFATVLNILCSKNLSVIAWLIVFIPFIFMTVITTLLLIAFGLDPEGKSLFNLPDKNKGNKPKNLDILPCDQINTETQCLRNKCEWTQMQGDPRSGRCKFSKKFGRHVGKDVGLEIAEGLIKNIGGDPATWGPPTSQNNTIGGDPATWGPSKQKNKTWDPALEVHQEGIKTAKKRYKEENSRIF